jgi:hypothetical protein
LALIFISVYSATFRFQYWLLNAGCSPENNPTWDVQGPENSCGVGGSQDGAYSKVTFNIDKDEYTLTSYTNSNCDTTILSFNVPRTDIGQCKTHLLINSYKFTLLFFCFPGDASVMLTDGSEKLMKDVVIGDEVMTQQGSSEVYAFLDYLPTQKTAFVYVHYFDLSGAVKSIGLSSEHLLLASRSGEEKFVTAGSIQSGDFIYTSENGQSVSILVSHVETQEKTGAFAPLTKTGTIIVDGVIASNYAVFDHDIAHAVLAPLRLASSLGLTETEVQKGMHPYARMLHDTFTSFLYNPGVFGASILASSESSV